VRVLLISSNSLRPSPQLPWVAVEPLGLAYVAASLRGAGRAVEFLDLCFVEDRNAAVRDALARSRPDVIGISLRNVDLMAYFNPLSFVGEFKGVVDECRRSSAAPIVLGGSGFSVMPGELLRFTGADAGIAGEGEWSFPWLLDRLERGEGYADVPGVVFPSAGERGFEMASAAFESLDHGMRPARDLIDGARYRTAGGTASVQSKRGCPFGCIYCTYPIVEGAAVRCRPPEDVAEEFRELFDRHGIGEAYIVDNQFNYPPSHAAGICERLIAQRDTCKVRWSCMVNPVHMSEELALMMRLARCTMVDLSVESGSDRILEVLGKGYAVSDVERAIAVLKECRLPFGTWVLFGGPLESRDTVRETLDFLAAADVPNVLFGVGIRICPGTKIERIARDEGVIENRTDLLHPVFYLSMSAREIVSEIEPYLTGRPGWRIAALARRSK
jgi:radical SAM superfamily enzyme YgiQ (UPF0313 family)